MGFNISESSLQETAFIVAVVGVSLAIFATILRFEATRRADRKVGWEDWFAVLATFFYIAYVIPFLYILRIFNGQDTMKLSLKDYTNMTKAGYVMAAQFCLQQLFAKLSILALYYRLFFVDVVFVRAIYSFATIQTIWSIVTYVLHWVECTPPAKLWKPKLKGKCLNAPAFLAAGESINSLIDFALVGLAIYLVQHLQLRASVKLRLGILFGLGSLAGVLGFVKIAQGYIPMKAERVALLDPIWACVQQACSVICCCAPIYKALLPKMGLFNKIRSTFSGRSRSKASSKSPSTGGLGKSDEAGSERSSESRNTGGRNKKRSQESMQFEQYGLHIDRNESEMREPDYANMHLPHLRGEEHV